jgi:hypothetical protein
MNAVVTTAASNILLNAEVAVITLLSAALLGVVLWGANRGFAWLATHQKVLSVEQLTKVQALFSETMMKVAVAGVGQAAPLVHSHGWDSPVFKSAAISAGITYAAAEFPDVLAQVGIDPTDPAQVAAKVSAALDRLFPQAAAIVAASPATPDASITAASLAVSSPA